MKKEEEKRRQGEKEGRVGKISWLPEFQIAAIELLFTGEKSVYG